MVCKHWQQAHDGLIRALVQIKGDMMPTTTASWQRFQGVTSLDVSRSWRGAEVMVARLMSMASVLTSLTSLGLRGNRITAAEVTALAPLMALTDLGVSVDGNPPRDGWHTMQVKLESRG
eukprot:371172-Prorocentrum_minimum.AAC.1